MELVLDANILFAALIKDSKTAELMLDPRLELHIPEFALQEFSKYEQHILKKTSRTKEEFQEILAAIKKIAKIIPREEFKMDCTPKFARVEKPIFV
ncbi:MAG: PIN domain-containing protein [Candidatus Micrarchaeota archaeon]